MQPRVGVTAAESGHDSRAGMRGRVRGRERIWTEVTRREDWPKTGQETLKDKCRGEMMEHTQSAHTHTHTEKKMNHSLSVFVSA